MKLIGCTNCGMKVPKEIVAIECPNCYFKGFDKEREKIIKYLKEELLTKGRRPNRSYIKEVLNRISQKQGSGKSGGKDE